MLRSTEKYKVGEERTKRWEGRRTVRARSRRRERRRRRRRTRRRGRRGRRRRSRRRRRRRQSASQRKTKRGETTRPTNEVGRVKAKVSLDDVEREFLLYGASCRGLGGRQLERLRRR